MGVSDQAGKRGEKMQFAKRLFLGLGAVALMAVLLTLAAPKAVHGLVATLVQVANTAANPVVAQDTSKTAAQIVTETCDVPSGYGYGVIPCGPNPNTDPKGYIVPSGQNWIVTSLTITSNGTTGRKSVRIANGNGDEFDRTFQVQNGVTTQFSFPSGIVIHAGDDLIVISTPGSDGEDVLVNGYLTAN
jgi:hypothetical protein